MIKMKKTLLAASISAMAFSQMAYAEDSFWSKITWAPTAGVQMKNLSFDQDLNDPNNLAGGTRSGDFEVDMPVLSLGLTAVYDRFYVAIKRDDSFDDALTNTTVPFTGGKSSVEREDMSLTFGMNVVTGLNVFVGYMDGETTLKNITGFASAQTPRYTQEYKEDGLFTGVSYSLPIKEMGTLSFSTAYAFMDGTYEDNFNGAPNQDFEYDGDSEGLSLGVTWSAPITETIGYYLDLRYQQYDFEGDDANGNFPTTDVETEEKLLTYSAGLQWYF